MAWVIIRKATIEDGDRLAAAKARFAERHDLQDDLDWAIAIEDNTAPSDEQRRLRELWRACTRRALREPAADGIAWETVGYHVD